MVPLQQQEDDESKKTESNWGMKKVFLHLAWITNREVLGETSGADTKPKQLHETAWGFIESLSRSKA